MTSKRYKDEPYIRNFRQIVYEEYDNNESYQDLNRDKNIKFISLPKFLNLQLNKHKKTDKKCKTYSPRSALFHKQDEIHR